MSYKLRTHRRQGNGLVVPSDQGGLATTDEARRLGKQSLAAQQELQYAEIINEQTGDVMETLNR